MCYLNWNLSFRDGSSSCVGVDKATWSSFSEFDGCYVRLNYHQPGYSS